MKKLLFIPILLFVLFSCSPDLDDINFLDPFIGTWTIQGNTNSFTETWIINSDGTFSLNSLKDGDSGNWLNKSSNLNSKNQNYQLDVSNCGEGGEVCIDSISITFSSDFDSGTFSRTPIDNSIDPVTQDHIITRISCQEPSISDDLGTFYVVSDLSKNSDGTGDLTIDDFKFEMITMGGTVSGGSYRPSSIDNISQNCSSGNLYILSGPLILLEENIDQSYLDIIGFNIGQSYTISQLGDLYEDYYLSNSFPICESSSACEMGKIGRVDVILRGYDSSGSLINFNQLNGSISKCAENNLSNLPNFVRYSLNANGCGPL